MTDASSEGSADTRSDTTVRVDAGPDGVTDAGAGVESGPPPTGMVTITEIGFRADVNLTAEGTIDWAHWGATSATSFNHKATGGGKISDLTQRGGFRYSTSMTTFAWSDGSPTPERASPDDPGRAERSGCVPKAAESASPRPSLPR